jgi:hypothetical protein
MRSAAACVAILCMPAVAGQAQAPPEAGMTVVVDAQRAAQRLTYVHEEIPVSPGTLALAYPKWIPGEHGPTGPIQHVGDVRVAAGGRTLPWMRDPDDMYTLRVDVPAGSTVVTVDFAVVLENTISDGSFCSPGIRCCSIHSTRTRRGSRLHRRSSCPGDGSTARRCA